jgi:cbb3-type cytochrome oxidase maturation protein
MTVLLFLVPISLLLVGLALAVFVWAVRSGQFEDLDTPSFDILGDERAPPSNAAEPPTEGTRDAD